MPIYHKAPPSIVGNHNTAEIDYHTSEAAKVKRTREQAYFNSYDFDAIEVLPYNDDEEAAGVERRSTRRAREAAQDMSQAKQFQLTQQHLQQHQLKQQQQQHPSNHNSFMAGHSKKEKSFMVSSNQHQQHVNHKYNPSIYLQRLSGLFANKTSGSNNKLQHHPHQNNNNNNSHTPAAACVVDIVSMDKHLKLSSSETSSTSLSSSSAIEEVLTDSSAASGHRDAVSECVVDNGGSSSLSAANMDKLVNTKGASGNGGNFLLPRAMLKYQSTSVVAAATTAAAAPSNLTANTNSMPLATAACNNTITQKPKQHQQQPLTRDVSRIEGNGKGKVATMLTGNDDDDGGNSTELRLKKNSLATSIATSLNSEDLSVTKPGHNVVLPQTKAMEERKVLPKTINPKSAARASSHQSHYSTDKSASSGYYSSNVCSTYSLEEPIYSEPTVDIKDIRSDTKESNNKPPLALSSPGKTLQAATLKPALMPAANEMDSVMRALDFNRRYRFADNETVIGQQQQTQTLPAAKRNSLEFSENLKILESSIENLDRHLKSFPQAANPDAIVAYGQNPYSSYTVQHNDKMRSSSSYNHLPTIQEGFEKAKNQIWIEERSDDSLMDIDLDSFLLDKDKQLSTRPTSVLANTKGIDNPSFLTDEQEENHYKCAKYINSCPEDAYRVESDILAPTRSSISEQSVAASGELYPKHYVEQLHFQNTRELLEDVRDKIRHLTQAQASSDLALISPQIDKEPAIPKELNSMIGTLKQELELYLERMNHNSDLEIRQLCTGLVKNQHIVKMTNAFERRRSLTDSNDICSTYEAVHDGIVMNAAGAGPISITQQITSIRCTSDPNFKMKRKSITEVFPMAECYIETIETDPNELNGNALIPMASQLQRNLNYHKPILEQLHAQLSQKPENLISSNPQVIGFSSASGGDTSETNDKESILDWHRKKPSIWEMYYGTNRIQQSLLGGKKNGALVTTTIASSPSTMCYPSSRPESDFTLDLPRAEQLRIKMEKEKKFRHRCRVITTFLSLVFFLLTVMVVSLVLTRGKRMFGSMI